MTKKCASGLPRTRPRNTYFAGKRGVLTTWRITLRLIQNAEIKICTKTILSTKSLPIEIIFILSLQKSTRASIEGFIWKNKFSQNLRGKCEDCKELHHKHRRDPLEGSNTCRLRLKTWWLSLEPPHTRTWRLSWSKIWREPTLWRRLRVKKMRRMWGEESMTL